MIVPSTPFRLGYFIEQRQETCFGWPSIEYRGIDRLNFSFTDRGKVSAEAQRLEDAYVDALYLGDLNGNRELAFYYQERFAELGLDVEVIYAEIGWTPEYETGWFESGFDGRRNVHDSIGQRPGGLAFSGFDISYPFPDFHSAIAQPGLHEIHPEMADSLNQNGLFDQIDPAKFYARLANETDNNHGPFCVLGIWGIE